MSRLLRNYLLYPFRLGNTASRNQEEDDAQQKEYWNPTSRCYSPVIETAAARKSVLHTVKYLGYLDLIKNVAALVAVGFLATLIHSDKKALVNFWLNDADIMDFLNLSPTAQMTIFATMTVLLTIAILLTILLLQGIYEKDSQKIGIWFIYQLLVFIKCTIFHSCLVLILWVLPQRYDHQYQHHGRKRHCAQILSVILFVNYYWVGYQMYMVNSLLKEIKKERKSWRTIPRGNYNDARDCNRSRNSIGIRTMITSSPDSGWNEDIEYLV